MILKFFKLLSIKRKITIVVISISSFTLTLGFIIATIHSVDQKKSELVSSALKNAELLAEYSIVPLVFSDTILANKNLEVMRKVPSVSHVSIYNSDGDLFVCFHNSDDYLHAEQISDHFLQGFHDGFYNVFLPLYHNNERQGSIHLSVSTKSMLKEIRINILVFGVLLLVLILLAVLLANIFQKAITTPILKLSAVMKNVSENKDYSSRIESDHQDEIGILYRGFNNMLEQIQYGENLIRRNEERFRSIYNNVNDAIFIFNIQTGNVEDVNEKMLEMFRYSDKSEVKNLLFNRFFSHISPDSYEAANSWIKKGLDEPQIFEWQAKRKNDELFWVEISLKKVELLGKERILMVVRDISIRKRFEFDLKAAKEKAEESDRLKSAFLANMSHEIRTPMNGIMGFAELLQEPQLSGEDQQKYLEIILKSGNRMLNIINDLINISKIEAGQMTIQKDPIPVNETIEEVSLFFKPEAALKGIELLNIYSFSGSEDRIITDKAKLQQILTNLVKNALKFSKRGVIEIGYNLKSPALLEFYVRDNGIGIPEDLKTEIFERFRQVEDKYARQYEGAGLGLSICKAFVEMLGGEIWVESVEGEGSTFFFTLPYEKG